MHRERRRFNTRSFVKFSLLACIFGLLWLLSACSGSSKPSSPPQTSTRLQLAMGPDRYSYRRPLQARAPMCDIRYT